METVDDMAGDWIKFETATLDKPEVCQIADAADIDVDAVIGKLLRVWAWFDEQTSDGNAPSVSKRLLDRLVGVPNFCNHMIFVGWLNDENGFISIPNFERHNGKTAKTRLLTNRRVANHYANANADPNAEPNADSVRKPLTREDIDIDKDQKHKSPPTPKREKAGSEQFAVFWKLYPSKKGKAEAEKAWGKILAEQVPMIMQSLHTHRTCRDWIKDDGQFIPMASTWLNKKRFEDEVKPYVTGQNSTGASARKPSLSEQVRIKNAHLLDEDEYQPPDLGDFDGEFSRIDETDGSLVGDDDGHVWAQVE